MEYKLAAQIGDQNLLGIISREIKKQRISVPPASKKQLKEIAAVSKQIQKNGLPEYLVKKKLPKGLGFGIFLHPDAKPIPKGRVIAPYAGEVFIAPQNAPDDSAYVFELISHVHLLKKEQALLSKGLCYHPRRHYSINLDALRKGNFTRFINHSEIPNVIAHMACIPPNNFGLTPSPLQIIYFAKKTILPGEQLLVCYEGEEKSYWTSLKIKPVPMGPKTFQLNCSLQIQCRSAKMLR